jgi:hypothetical protein
MLLVELCKAEKGVQKDKRNQREQNLLGVFSAQQAFG